MAEQFSKVALVVNAASRAGAQAYDTAYRRLCELGVEPDIAYPIRDPERLAAVLTSVVDDGCDLVIVGGGDGTLSAAINQLSDHDVTLGILPLGTANDLARTLQIPADLEAACATIANGTAVAIDIGAMGERNFCNVASIGLAVGVTHALSNTLKRWLGPLAYPVAAVRAYRRHQSFRVHLEFPDGDHGPLRVDHTLAVAVGNGRYYGGGNVVAPDAGIGDHLLDVYAIPRGTLRERLGVIRRVRDGTFVDYRHVVHVTTQRVRLHAEPEQSVNLDGELVGSTPQEFAVQPEMLDVLVPAHSAAGSRD